MPLKTGNWKQNLVLEGRCYQVTVGSFSSPITGGGAGTVLDNEQPEFRLTIPSGTSVIPLRIRVDCQTPLIAADADECEILIAVDRTQALTDGTATTTETAINMRTDLTGTNLASACTAKSAFTVDATTAVMSMELAHRVVVADVQGTPANALWGSLWEEYAPVAAPVIVGPASLLVYWGGTVAVTGFASVEWAEYPTAVVTT